MDKFTHYGRPPIHADHIGGIVVVAAEINADTSGLKKKSSKTKLSGVPILHSHKEVFVGAVGQKCICYVGHMYILSKLLATQNRQTTVLIKTKKNTIIQRLNLFPTERCG